MTSKEKIFAESINQNQGIIHKVCRIYTDDSFAHEDLFQEIVLQLWKSYDSFKGDSKFSTWMYRVGLNTAITYIRKKSKTNYTTLEDHHQHALINENNEEHQEKLELLYMAIKYLNDVERALVLLYLEDSNYKEIAETLGITEVNARVKMNRVKTKLKEIMDQLSR